MAGGRRAGYVGAMTKDAAPIATPCVQVCTLMPSGGDPFDDLCLGCARSRREIAAWSTMSEAARATVMAALPERARTLHATLTTAARRAAR